MSARRKNKKFPAVRPENQPSLLTLLNKPQPLDTKKDSSMPGRQVREKFDHKLKAKTAVVKNIIAPKSINTMQINANSSVMSEIECLPTEELKILPNDLTRSTLNKLSEYVEKIKTCSGNGENNINDLCILVAEALTEQVRENQMLKDCIVANNDGLNSQIKKSNLISSSLDGVRQTVSKHNDKIDDIVETQQSHNDMLSSIDSRLNRIETLYEASMMSEKLNIIPLCAEERNDIDLNSMPLMTKVIKIFRFMNINFNYSSINKVKWRDGYRMINGQKTYLKMIVVEFVNDKLAGKLFSQIVRYNRNAPDDNFSVRYFAEVPIGKNVINLKFICRQLKIEGHLTHITTHNRGLTVTYKQVNDINSSTPQASQSAESGFSFKTHEISCEDDINQLRKILKLDNADVPLRDLYKRESNLNFPARKRQRDDFLADDDWQTPKRSHLKSNINRKNDSVSTDCSFTSVEENDAFKTVINPPNIIPLTGGSSSNA